MRISARKNGAGDDAGSDTHDRGNGSSDYTEAPLTALEKKRGMAEPALAERIRSHLAKHESIEVARLVQELGAHQTELETLVKHLLQVEAALEASRDRYIALYKHAPVAYVVVGAGGLIIEANRVAAQLLGVPLSQLVRKRLVTCFTARDRRRFQVASALARRRRGVEVADLRLSGSGARRETERMVSAHIAVAEHLEETAQGNLCVALVPQPRSLASERALSENDRDPPIDHL